MTISLLTYVLKRTFGHRFLLASVFIGTLLAIVIASGSAIYFDSLGQLVLQRELDGFDPARLDVLIRATRSPVDADGHAQLVSDVNGRIDRMLSPVLDSYSYGVKSSTLFLARSLVSGSIPEQDRRRASIAALPDLRNHTRLVSGVWPENGTPAPAGREDVAAVIRASVPAEVAKRFDLVVGQQITLVPTWDDQRDDVVVEVTGLFEPLSSQAPIWNVINHGFGIANSQFDFVMFFVPEDVLVSQLGSHFPEMTGSYAWAVDIDEQRITPSDTDRAIRGLDEMRSELRNSVDGFQQITDLGTALTQFETRFVFGRIAMLVVTALVILAVLYYVATAGTLIMEARQDQIAMMRSRGATGPQIAVAYVSEAAFMVAFSVALGPPIALVAVKLIGVLPTLVDLNGGDLLPARITELSYVMAAFTGAATLVALSIPAVRASRVRLVHQLRRASRPPAVSTFQRYYLDIAFLGLVLFFFWQLSKQGSFVAIRLFGEATVDQLVVAVPALFMVAAGIVLVRILPAFLELLGRALSSRLGARIVPTIVVLGLWNMARNPMAHTRLLVLLILAAGLGVFAATFRTSLEQSFIDQAFYESGADMRVLGLSAGSRRQADAARNDLVEMAGVHAITAVARESGSFSGEGFSRAFTMLGIEADRFASVGWSRADFAEVPFADLMDGLTQGRETGIAIPEDATWLSARIRPLESRADLSLVARMSDARGHLYSLNLGSLEPRASFGSPYVCETTKNGNPPGWCRLGAPIDRVLRSIDKPVLPLRLELLGIAQGYGSPGAGIGVLEIDDVAVAFDDPLDVRVIDTFEDAAQRRTEGSALGRYGARLEPAMDPDGGQIPGVARLTWAAPAPDEVRGIEVGPMQVAFPVIAGRSFMERSGHSVGDEVELTLDRRTVAVEIVAVAEYFPTVDPNVTSLLVANISDMWRALNLDLLPINEPISEFWVTTAAAAPDVDEVRESLRRRGFRFVTIEQRASLLEESRQDPLASAGWRALLGVAFAAVMLVSAIGFIIHAQVTYRARRGELAVFRAVGLSIRQLLALIVLEQVLVIGLGVGVGVALGYKLGATVLPFLSISEEQLELVPPLLVETDWGALGILFGSTAVVFASVIVVILVLVYTMSLHSELKGERD